MRAGKYWIVAVAFAVCGGLLWLAYLSRPRAQRRAIRIDPNTWVKCRDPNCEAAYEMNTRQYFLYMEDHVDPAIMVVPPLRCEKCGKESVYAATKCVRCGLVFEITSHIDDDGCPNPECPTWDSLRAKKGMRD